MLRISYQERLILTRQYRLVQEFLNVTCLIMWLCRPALETAKTTLHALAQSLSHKIYYVLGNHRLFLI
jgi:hypothetical protein